MTTRATTRANIKRVLRQFPIPDTVGVGGFNTSVTTFLVTNIDRYGVGDTIEIGAELMLITAIDTSTSTLTVVRGYQGTTAAAGIAGDAIAIRPEFSADVMNQCINYGINETFTNIEDGSSGIWIDTIDTTLVTVLAQREYTIPASLTTLDVIEIKDSNNNYQINRRWRLVGTKLVFMRDPLESGKTIRISGTSYQPQISSDATTFLLADEQLEFVEWHAVLCLLETRLPARLKATEYSASVNDRAGQPNEILTMLGYIKRKSKEIKKRESKPKKSGYMMISQR